MVRKCPCSWVLQSSHFDTDFMQATIVRDLADATHIIEDNGDTRGQDEEGEYFRTLEKRDGMVLLHYWYNEGRLPVLLGTLEAHPFSLPLFIRPFRYTPDSSDIWARDAHNYVDPEVYISTSPTI
jgi:hypothetical protein